MIDIRENISQAVVPLARTDLRAMVRVVRLLDKLGRDPAYRQLVYDQVPPVAAFDPGHDAVMMCYDFHLTGEGPRLIEVNTNAGGGLLAYLALDPMLPVAAASLKPRLRNRLLETFADEIKRFTGGGKSKPERIAIVDEEPARQSLYSEMSSFAELFRNWGVPAEVVDPRQLQASAAGVRLEGQPIDLIYNRHCDFYLEGDSMRGVREAYLARKVCLSPNPHMYGLLADKRRMVTWSDPDIRRTFSLTDSEQQLLGRVLPASTLLADHDPAEVWSARKRLVFKPVDSFGSRGVLLGEKISRKRFDELPPETTLVQEMVPPSMTEVPYAEPMKTDLRLYAYRSRVLGVTARLFRGQVTNLRTPGGGFARVRVV